MLRNNRGNTNNNCNTMTSPTTATFGSDTSNTAGSGNKLLKSGSPSTSSSPSFSLSTACSSISPFAWGIIGFLTMVLFLGGGGSGVGMMHDLSTAASYTRSHRTHSGLERSDHSVAAAVHDDGAEVEAQGVMPRKSYRSRGGLAKTVEFIKGQKDGGSPADLHNNNQKQQQKKRPMTVTMKGQTQTPTQNWTKVKDDLLDKVVPELGIVVISQEETEAINEITDPSDERFVRLYQTSNGRYVLNVPSDERLPKFREMVTNGRFGKLLSPLTERRKLVEAPMKDLEVEIKLAEADVERIEKLSTETAKNLDEKLQLNAMLRDALRSLEYLKSQQRKITSQVEYAEVTLWLNEKSPELVYPEEKKISPMVVFFGVFLSLLGIGTVYFAFFPSPSSVKERYAVHKKKESDPIPSNGELPDLAEGEVEDLKVV